MCSGGVDLFPLHDAYCYIDGATPKHRAAEDHLYHCMALLSTSHSFSWSRWNLLAGRRNMVLQMKEFLEKKRQVRKVQKIETFFPIIMHTLYIYSCNYMHLVLLFLNICIISKQSLEHYIYSQRRLPDMGMDNLMCYHITKSLVLCILKKIVCLLCICGMNCHKLLRFLVLLILEISNFRFSYFHQVYPTCGSYKLIISGIVHGRYFSKR